MTRGVWGRFRPPRGPGKAVIEGPEGYTPPPSRISEVWIMWKPFVTIKMYVKSATPFWLRPYVTSLHFLLKEYLMIHGCDVYNTCIPHPCICIASASNGDVFKYSRTGRKTTINQSIIQSINQSINYIASYCQELSSIQAINQLII